MRFIADLQSQKLFRATSKGFTLVELLIVIGILAVLATTAVVILNPAQLLAQARDSQRIADLSAINKALSLYAFDVSLSTQDLNGDDGTIGVTTRCDGSNAAAGVYIYRASGTNVITTDSFVNANRIANEYYITSKIVGATGWLPVKFGDISTGSPLSVLPVDPIGLGAANTNFVYRYACQQPTVPGAGTYEINACLESSKYKPLMGTDGGDKPTSGVVAGTDTCASVPAFYEIGNETALDL